MSEKKCRVCYEASNSLIEPCNCNGSMKYIHKECLFKWIKEKNNNECVCEVCNCQYNFINKFKIIPIELVVRVTSAFLLIFNNAINIDIYARSLLLYKTITTLSEITFEVSNLFELKITKANCYFFCGISILSCLLVLNNNYLKRTYRYQQALFNYLMSDTRKYFLIKGISEISSDDEIINVTKNNFYFCTNDDTLADVTVDFDINGKYYNLIFFKPKRSFFPISF